MAAMAGAALPPLQIHSSPTSDGGAKSPIVATRRNSVFGEVWSSPERRLSVLREISNDDVRTHQKQHRSQQSTAVLEDSESGSDSD